MVEGGDGVAEEGYALLELARVGGVGGEVVGEYEGGDRGGGQGGDRGGGQGGDEWEVGGVDGDVIAAALGEGNVLVEENEDGEGAYRGTRVSASRRTDCRASTLSCRLGG